MALLKADFACNETSKILLPDYLDIQTCEIFSFLSGVIGGSIINYHHLHIGCTSK
jgi:hypothetical protein